VAGDHAERAPRPDHGRQQRRARVAAQREHQGEDGQDRDHGAAREHTGREVARPLAQVVERVHEVGGDEGRSGKAERVQSSLHRLRGELT
jgi:hypothetical protein